MRLHPELPRGLPRRAHCGRGWKVIAPQNLSAERLDECVERWRRSKPVDDFEFSEALGMAMELRALRAEVERLRTAIIGHCGLLSGHHEHTENVTDCLGEVHARFTETCAEVERLTADNEKLRGGGRSSIVGRAFHEGAMKTKDATIDRLTAELEAKSDVLVSIAEIKAKRGERVQATFDGEFVEAMMLSMVDWFDANGGKNYVEARCTAKGREFVFTMQAANGESPAEQAARLTAELARARHAVSGCCPQSEALAKERERTEAALQRLRDAVNAYREFVANERDNGVGQAEAYARLLQAAEEAV